MKSIIKGLIQYRIARDSKSISKEDGVKLFDKILGNQKWLANAKGITSACLVEFATNSAFSWNLPSELKHLLCGTDTKGKALSNKVKREIEDAIDELIRDYSKAKQYLQENDILKFYWQHENSYILITSQDIKCLNNKLFSQTLNHPLITNDVNAINMYSMKFKSLCGFSLVEYLQKHPIIIFYNSKLGILDNLSIKQFHCNSIANTNHRSLVKEFSLIVQPALTQNRKACYIMSMPLIDQEDFNYIEIVPGSSILDIYKSLIEKYKDKFRLIFKSAISMKSEGIVMPGFGNEFKDINIYAQSFILKIFIDIYDEMKDLPGLPQISFFKDYKNSLFFNIVSPVVKTKFNHFIEIFT
ncbi:MAG: hypothetical protein ACK5Z5_00970 [Neisseriaceae bacterium]